MEQFRLLRIVVASPGDVKAERNTMDRVVAELNQGIAADRGLRLKLVRWETDTHPGFNKEGPQGLIDPLLRIEDCDVLIGIFWKRFGTPTHDSQSGTEHEFKIAYGAWKKNNSRPQIFVYFNQRPSAPKSSAEAEQWKRVLEFKENFPKEGLWWPYSGRADFEGLVRLHLTNFIRQHFPLADSAPREGAGLQPGRGQAQHRSPAELDELYLARLIEQVGKVYILGEGRDLRKVFVELNVIEEYERPLMHVEYLDIMAAQLQQQQNIFEAEDKANVAGTQAEEKHKQKQVIRPEELLRGRTRAIITGTPGCGKTTLAKYLALRANEERKLYPVFLELKIVTEDALRRAGNNLADLLFELAVANKLHLESAESQQFRQYFYSRLAAHEAVICLDGLDEVSDPALLSQICNCVSSFINDPYGDNAIIITTRTYALQRIDGMKQMEIALLNGLQIEEFLDHYYGGDPAVTSLLKAFRQRTQLRELMRVPFLLAVIFQLHRAENIIIENRLELYRQITYQLAMNLDREKPAVRRGFLIKDPGGSLKLDFLSHLACVRLFVEEAEDGSSDHESARLVFTGAAILEQAKEFVEKSRLAHISPYDLAADVKAAALLREVGADIYAFAHLTIQEYLAARALKERPDLEKLFCRALFNPTLAESEALPMVLGMVSNPTRFYVMLEALPESLTFVNLRLRARGLGYVSKLDDQPLTALGDLLIEFITQRRVEDAPFEQAVRRSFSEAAGKPAEAILERVITLLRSKEHDLRMRAIAVLEQVGGEKALLALVETFDRDKGSPLVRARIAEALGRMGGELSAKVLIKGLKDDDKFVMYAATDALGQIGGERVVAALTDALTSADAQLRRRSAEALLRMGSEHAVGALSKILEIRDLYLREKAAAALGRIGGEQATHVLIKTLASGDKDLHAAAVRALGQIGGEKVVDALLEALNHSDIEVRARAAVELGSLGRVRALPALVDATKEDDDPYVRASAAGALGQIGGGRALEVLSALLDDDSSPVRAAAAGALGHIADERAVAALLKALKDPDAAVSLKAVEGLRTARGEQATAGLIEALGGGDGRVRKRIVKAVAELLGKQSIEALLRASDSDSPDVRAASASALGQAGGERALRSLIALLDDASGYVRGAVAEALGQLGDERAVPALLKAAGDADIYVRGLAVAALGQIGGEQTLEALLPALRDETLYVRVRAAAALGQVGGVGALKGLTEAVRDPDFDVRIIAADSLTQIGGERAGEILYLEGSNRGSADDRWRFYAKLAWTKIEQNPAKLVPALEDEDVAPAVADALGRISGEQVVALLIGALNATQAEVRKRAAASLAKIDKEQLGRGLLKALSHKDAFVRTKASEAIGYYRDDQVIYEQLSILAMVDAEGEVQTAAQDAMNKFVQKRKSMGWEISNITLTHARG